MADLFGFDIGGMSLGGMGGSIGVFAFIILILFWAMRQREQNAIYGPRDERRLEREEGMGPIAKFIRKLEERSKRERKEEEGVGKKEKGITKMEKKQKAPKSEIKADNAAGDVTKAATAQSKLQKYTEALQARGVGISASSKLVLASINSYLSRVKNLFQRQEIDFKVIEQLMRKLRNTTNFSTIDERVSKYLNELFGTITKDVGGAVDVEKSKGTFHKELVGHLRTAVKEARDVIKAARTALSDIKGAEKEEKKDFKKEFKDITASFNKKRQELKAIRRTKGANPMVIKKLQEEIGILNQQRGAVKGLNNQLNNTYRNMDNEIKGMRRLLSAITRSEKKFGKFEKAADKREGAIEGRLSKIQQFADELRDSTKDLTNPHDLAIQFSGKMKIFYDKYIEIVKEDLDFDVSVRNILLLQITIAVQKKAFDRLSTSLTQAKAALSKGVAAATAMVSAIVGNPQQQVNLKDLLNDIKNQGGDINYESRVDQYMSKLDDMLFRATRRFTAGINELINEDTALIETLGKNNLAYSTNIGTAMATMVDRKLQIDKKYMSQARIFENQLKTRNNMAHKAYQQVHGLRAPRPSAPRPRPAFAH